MVSKSNYKNNRWFSHDRNQDGAMQDRRTYLQNPSVTPTALAHSLWSQVIRPYQDVIIDATAGNGKDSLTLATFLFPNHYHRQYLPDTYTTSKLAIQQTSSLPPLPAEANLFCIDIQQRACENTQMLLEQHFSQDIMKENVNIIHSSHAPLPVTLPSSSVGLICYNLGYLPGIPDQKSYQTQMMTTIFSLTDAALLIREGGLLSVMTYPANGCKEYCAVKYFFEGLAMLTSKRVSWKKYIESIPNDDEIQRQHDMMYGTGKENVQVHDILDKETMSDDSFASTNHSIRQSVQMGVERVAEQGPIKLTWRVFDHRPLGRPLSPILFTAMRIK